ncbi:ABC transporter permease [Fodinicola feengrottensis]|uniref:ABC transporter permease n=1 Tax=Fodinicola feengrottensis TaxID=435914 RepID=UPI0013D0EC14|nr:ABC transporter permease [Fodinicola feengrottensis]
MPSSNPLLGFFLEVCVLAKRYLIHLRRQPQQLMFATAQPALFVLMFRFVFGGAIKIGAGATNYASYLMPGIFIQSVTLGAMTIGVRLAEDMHSGLIDRFRSLPISRAAVLTGHTTAGLLRNLFVVCIVFVVGLAVGFRPALDPLGWLAAIALILGFTFAIFVGRGDDRALCLQSGGRGDGRADAAHAADFLSAARSFRPSRCPDRCAGLPNTSRSASLSTQYGRCSWAPTPAPTHIWRCCGSSASSRSSRALAVRGYLRATSK